MGNQSEKKFLFQLSVEEFEDIISNRIRTELEALDMPDIAHKHEQENLLKIDEVTQIFKVTKKTIFNWIKSGQLKCHRTGGRLFFKKSEIENSLEPSRNFKSKS